MSAQQEAAKAELHNIIVQEQTRTGNPDHQAKADTLRRIAELTPIAYGDKVVGPMTSAGLPAPIRPSLTNYREPAPSVAPQATETPSLLRLLGWSPWRIRYGNAALGWRTRGG